MTITSLSDSQFGTFFPATRQHDMDSTTCFALAGVPLQPGESTSCVIVATLRGQSGETHVNRATIGADDDEGTPATAFADDTVAFNKVLPTIKVSKAAFPTTVPESGGTVTFAVAIENTSLEPVTVTSLVDSVDGGPPVDLTTLPGTCIAGAELKPGVTYTCLFTRTVVQTDGAPSETDVASAAVVDDDGDVAVGGAPAIVTFELIPPTVNIVQTDANFTVNEPGGDVTYALLITNTSFEPETVTSLSNPISYEVPDTDIIIDLLSQERAPLSKFECRDANHALINLATYRIAPAETVTCTFVLTLSGTAQIVRGDVRVTVVDDDGQHGADEDEEATPILDVAPEVDIVKTASPTVIDFGDTVTYTFTISNVKDVEPIRVLTLNDDTFGEIFDECVDTGGMATLLAPNDHLPGGADETTCTIERVLTETPGTTHVNTATVTAADDEIIADPLLLPVFDFDSAAVRTLTPNTSVVKTVTATPARDATGLWTVVYSIELTNTGPGTDVVDVEDTFSFGAGVDVQAATVTGPPGVTLNPGFDGAGDPMIADDAVIAAETTQTYTVTVTARIDDAVPGENAGTCDAEGVSAGGFLNSVTLTSTATGEVDSDFACAPFSTLTLVKNLSNNDGGNATLADFILTAAANGITYVSGTGTVTEAVPAGTYSLAETTKAGYTESASGFTCTTEQTGSSVSVASASEVTCTLSNDDQALDLQLTQSDGGFTGTSGQQPPFPYTITVRNLGPRDVDNEPVTVVDDLPVAFEWVAPAPAGCAIAGQKLTCDVAPASLRPAGTTVTITATARLKAGGDGRAPTTTGHT